VSGHRRLSWLVGALALLWVIGQAVHAAGGTPTSGHVGSQDRTARPTPSPRDTGSPGRTSDASGSAADVPGSAAAVLGTLPVKGRAPMTGYSRARFGPAWLDADRNGCDTRNDVLRRDLTAVVLDPDTHGCVVLRGVLPDPYLGTDLPFARGPGDQVDIDHVVALGDAWATGAFRLDIAQRAALANDPLNLLAVDAHSNRAKGDADAATWLPAYRSFRCAYVARQVAVKQKYGLWVTPAERAAILRVLDRCPGQPLPADSSHAPTRVDQHVTEPRSGS
jgi:hypothetical protein